MNIKKFNGVFSLILLLAAVCVGVYAIAKYSVVIGAVYIGITAFCVLGIIYSFCAKCECRSGSCSHVIPGKMTNLFPDRKQTNYSFGDIFFTIVSLLVILLFPQYWLWRNTSLVILFWILIAAAVVEILFFVCKNCKNKKCPVFKNV